MADYDWKTNSYNKGLPYQAPDHPVEVGALKTALTAFNSTSYTPARMLTMTYNDLVYAARLHGLTVNATL